MLAFLISPLARWGAVGVVMLGLFGYGAFQKNRAERIQTRFDAYKVQVQKDIATEQARQLAAGVAASAAFRKQLETAETETLAAEDDAETLRRLLANKPIIAGRGATEDDLRVLNR